VAAETPGGGAALDKAVRVLAVDIGSEARPLPSPRREGGEGEGEGEGAETGPKTGPETGPETEKAPGVGADGRVECGQSWGIGNRVGFVMLCDLLGSRLGYVVSETAVRAGARLSPDAPMNSLGSPSALRTPGKRQGAAAALSSPQRVCFSEADTIVLAEGGDATGPVRPVSARARSGEGPGKGGPLSAEGTAVGAPVEGGGLMTGQDILRLFSSIVEQEECTDTAAGVIKHMERTEVQSHRLSICLSIYLSIYLSVCLSVCLWLSICLSAV
jgi:hypothetical protein